MSAYVHERPYAEVGSRVADARKRLGLTQRALAERLGVSLWTVERLEDGEKSME